MNKTLTLILLMAVAVGYAEWRNDTLFVPHISADVDTTMLGAGMKQFIANHSGEGGGSAFPVGSIYINITGTDPNTELGYGTWTQVAGGRFLVGQTAGDADFDTAEETGGVKTHNHDTHTTDAVKSGTGATSVIGSSHSAENNVPPYFVVYIFKRTE